MLLKRKKIKNLGKRAGILMGRMQGTTTDSFLDGRVQAIQPEKGFRAGLDSVLLAASVSANSSTLLELGAGVGVASCCVLADLPETDAVMAEIESTYCELAHQNIVLNGFDKRANAIMVDVTAKGAVRLQAGLKADHYASVIANPPFFEQAAGTRSPQRPRAAARHMVRENLEAWAKTAATSAAPGGEIIFIHMGSALPDLLAAFATRFGNISVLPVVPRSGEAASRILIRGIKGSRAPLKLLSPLVLHGPEGRAFSPRAEEIFRGKARLLW